MAVEQLIPSKLAFPLKQFSILCEIFMEDWKGHSNSFSKLFWSLENGDD
jgi:hypothetical protein